jgi:hypothetical protein
LLGEPLSVRSGDVVVSGDPSFYAGEVGGPLIELFGGLLQRDAESLSEWSEIRTSGAAMGLNIWR